MKSPQQDENALIVIRRGSRAYEENESHGGSWKIAYADFVTAMMAFFLVMWLISVTSEDTRIAIANYFNPIKFAQIGDNPLNEKDNNQIADEKQKNNHKSNSGIKAEDRREATDRKKGMGDGRYKIKNFQSEEELMLEPYKTLSQIASSSSAEEQGEDKKKRLQSEEGVSEIGKEDSYRNLIIPEFSDGQDNVQGSSGVVKVTPQDKHVSGQSLALADNYSSGRSVVRVDGKDVDRDPALIYNKSDLHQTAEKQDTKGISEANGVSDILSDKAKIDAATVNSNFHKIEQVYNELQALQEERKDSKDGPALKVIPENKGFLIQLSDHDKYGMFDIGSSKPKKSLVQLSEKIGKILREAKGTIIIRGHTDARPYKNKHYDNWQLSTARAQMVYYMLIRSGIDPNSIDHIEGHADRSLLNKKDPNAAENRRVEIYFQHADADKNNNGGEQAKKDSDQTKKNAIKKKKK